MSLKHDSARKKLDLLDKRFDWSYFSCFASVDVCRSGGPIHAPHQQAFQLAIHPWQGDDEAWTVYRHETNARKDGKLVCRRWDREADRRWMLSLGGKKLPEGWRDRISIIERQFPLPARWVSTFERAMERLSVPPIAGPVRKLERVTEYTLIFWRNTQQSEFSWRPTPPKAWRPLANLLSSAVRSFRQYADGKPLASVDEILS